MSSNSSPRAIVFKSMGLISILAFVVLAILWRLFFSELDFAWILIITGIFFCVGYLCLSYLLERFVYRKIKLLYRNINKAKAPRNSNSKMRMSEDVIQEVENEVLNWALDRDLEIDNLKKNEKFRREFLGNVSHELKTPIFSIQGFLETLIDGAINDESVNLKYLKRAASNAERLEAIVKDLEGITSLESGDKNLEKLSFNLTDLIRESIESVADTAARSKIEISIKEGSDQPFLVLADPHQIGQVLINLLSNSIKYGKEDGQTLVGIYDMDKHILVEVSDDGIGVAEKDLGRLFERFFRADKSRSRMGGGTGLGLAIVKHILEAHGQTINVRSTIGQGSTFGFTLEKPNEN